MNNSKFVFGIFYNYVKPSVILNNRSNEVFHIELFLENLILYFFNTKHLSLSLIVNRIYLKNRKKKLISLNKINK